MQNITQTRDRVTNLLAALAMAHPEFPSEATLPRAAAIPSSNLGHLPLLDYHRLIRILWGMVAILEEERARRDRPWAWPAALIGGLLVWVALLSVKVPLWAAICGGVFVMMVLGLLLAFDFPKRAAELKAEQVRVLLAASGEPKTTSAERKFTSLWEGSTTRQPWVQYSDGMLSEDRALVFFTNGASNPLPGLGRLQSRPLFVCPPAWGEPAPGHSLTELMSVARESALLVAESVDSGNVATGLIVVVDSDTVAREHPYLWEEQPLLSVDAKHYLTDGGEAPLLLQTVAPDASARVFAGVQVLFPEYDTLATFAVRFFQAGTSVAFEVLVSTLGPPVETMSALQQKLYIHTRPKTSIFADKKSFQEGPRSALATRLSEWRSLYDKTEDVFMKKRSYANVQGLQPFDWKLLSAEMAAASQLKACSGRWIGIMTRQASWRERFSLAMTGDHFGAPECRATVRSFYDQLTRTILARLDEMSYDIGAYRDAAGRWTIHADKIDNMILGERVSVDMRKGDRAGADDGGAGTRAPASETMVHLKSDAA